MSKDAEESGDAAQPAVARGEDHPPELQATAGSGRRESWWWRLLAGSQPATDEEAPYDPTGPITVSPDPRKWRTRRGVFPEGRRREIWDKIVVPADPPERFASESLGELAGKLRTTDEDVAAAILAEAEAAYREPQQLIESAERRATTLQGTVAIAASVALAGGGLLLGPSRISGREWRIAIFVVLALFVVCLLSCAVRALGATVRIFNFEEPGYERIVERASMSNAEALTNRAAELLRASAVADMIGSVKVGLLRAAAWWFRVALVLLALLTAVVGAYAIWGSTEPPGQTAQQATKTTSIATRSTPQQKRRSR